MHFIRMNILLNSVCVCVCVCVCETEGPREREGEIEKEISITIIYQCRERGLCFSQPFNRGAEDYRSSERAGLHAVNPPPAPSPGMPGGGLHKKRAYARVCMCACCLCACVHLCVHGCMRTDACACLHSV